MGVPAIVKYGDEDETSHGDCVGDEEYSDVEHACELHEDECEAECAFSQVVRGGEDNEEPEGGPVERVHVVDDGVDVDDGRDEEDDEDHVGWGWGRGCVRFFFSLVGFISEH